MDQVKGMTIPGMWGQYRRCAQSDHNISDSETQDVNNNLVSNHHCGSHQLCVPVYMELSLFQPTCIIITCSDLIVIAFTTRRYFLHHKNGTNLLSTQQQTS